MSPVSWLHALPQEIFCVAVTCSILVLPSFRWSYCLNSIIKITCAHTTIKKKNCSTWMQTHMLLHGLSLSQFIPEQKTGKQSVLNLIRFFDNCIINLLKASMLQKNVRKKSSPKWTKCFIKLLFLYHHLSNNKQKNNIVQINICSKCCTSVSYNTMHPIYLHCKLSFVKTRLT